MIKRRIFSALLMLGELLMSSPAFPVSRVGNASISDMLLGFTASIPTAFPVSQNINKDSIRLSSLPQLQAAIPAITVNSSKIDVSPLLEKYPELSGFLKIEDFVSHFQNLSANWKSEPIGCVQVMINQSQRQTTAVVGWGMDKGIVLLGDNNLALAGIEFIIKSIRLTSGACDWK